MREGACGGMWGGGSVCVGGLLRIDQALEEANCATFEDEGTIMPLGSVSRRRGSQTTRGKHSDFCTGNPERLLPRPDKSVEVPRTQGKRPSISLAQPGRLSLGFFQHTVRLVVQPGCKEQAPSEDPATLLV